MAIDDPRIPRNRALVPTGIGQPSTSPRLTDADARVVRANANRPAMPIREVPRRAPGTALVPAGPRTVAAGAQLSQADADVVRANRGAPRTIPARPNIAAPPGSGMFRAGQAVGQAARATSRAAGQAARLGTAPVATRGGPNNIRAAPGQGAARAGVLATAAFGGATQGMATDTRDYRRRIGMDPDQSSLAGDLAARGLGVMSDVGANIIDTAAMPVNMVRGVMGKPALPSYREQFLDVSYPEQAAAPTSAPTAPSPGATAPPPAPTLPGAMPPVSVRASESTRGGVPALPNMTVAPRRNTLASFTVDQDDPAPGSPASATRATPGATSITGRDLGYGQMQDGVRVFSDGSGSIPRTMTDQQIAGLASGDRVTTIPAANFARPAPGVAASIASGGQTPALGSLPRRPETPMFSRQFDPVRAAQLDAAADLEAAMSQDMRSPLGRAARNASVRGQEDAYLQTVRGSAEGGIVGRANLAQEQVRDAGATQRTGMDIAGRLTEAGMMADAGMAQTLAARRPSIAQVPLADGTLGLLDAETGQMRVATGADGMPARPQLGQDPQAAKSRESLLARLSKNAAQLASASAMPGSPVAPEAVAQARRQAAMLEGLPMIENDAGDTLVQIDGAWVPLY